MAKNLRSTRETDSASRIAVHVFILIILLVIFSATALANGRRHEASPSTLAQPATFQPTKSPTFQRQGKTSTPVPPSRSLSPATIPGQTQVDQYTLALYHFDSANGNTTLDATGQHTATLYGNAVITSSGLYGGALQTDGNGSYVSTGYLGDLPQGTIEAFIDFRDACLGTSAGYFSILSAGGDYGSDQPVMILRLDPALNFHMLSPIDGWHFVTSGVNPCRYLNGPTPPPATMWPYDVWRFHHIAVTWGPRGLETWVDGVLHGVGNNVGITFNPPDFPINYACNPQSNMASTSYPLCDWPPMVVPTATPYAPGDYTGVPAAPSTFLIGCDPYTPTNTRTYPGWVSCFRGRIDEVRISNIQRTFAPAVVPTSTPTPTQTPDVISGAYTPDAYTNELYHFDHPPDPNPWNGILESVSGQSSAYLRGNAAIVSGGRFNSGMSLDGSGSYAYLNWLTNYSQGALEAWVKLTNATNVEILHGGSDYLGSTSSVRLGVDPSFGNTLGFYMRDANFVWNRADSRVDPSALVGSWHHVAGTWGHNGLQIWIDGQLCGTDPLYTGQSRDSMDIYLAGCDTSRCMSGMIDEVRFSDIQRSFALASGTFSPRQVQSGPSVVYPYQYFMPLFFVAPTSVAPSICGTSSASPARIKSIP